MGYTGSGNFIGITAGYSSFFIESASDDYGYGIVLGNNRTIYCAIGSRYYLSGGTVQKASLSIVARGNPTEPFTSKLVLRFPSLQLLKIKTYTGYSGTIRVVSGVDCNENYQSTADRTVYSTYRFYCGLLVSRTDDT